MASRVVSSGTTLSSSTTLSADDSFTVANGGAVSAAGPVLVWNLAAPQTANGITVTNGGTIRSTTGRVFDTTGTATGSTSFHIVNNAGASITAASDIMREQKGTAGGAITIDNAGTISAGATTTALARGVNIQEYATVGGVAGFGSFTVNNASGGIIASTDDTLRITTASGNADTTTNPVFTGTVAINNLGTIRATGSAGTGANSGQAIDFGDLNTTSGHVTITNGSTTNATAAITASDTDAIRPGNNGTVFNYGTITGSQATASSTDPTFQGSSNGIAASLNQTITVVNYATGTITGAKSGILGSRSGAAVAPAVSSNVLVTNYGTIIGANGKAVGADYATVNNAGTISARINTTYLRGDGDGIDVTYTLRLTNSGRIEALGARGADDNGRTNIADALAIGGGSVDNSGTIFSVGNGVTVNNDSNPDGSRSGNIALTLTNQAGGTIEADGGYAIRSENKAGTDQTAGNFANDTVVNYGAIIGNGALPSTTPVTVTSNGTTTLDPGTIGMVDGTAYTAANAGSDRFILGDGSAIQLGEGDDVLSNYGSIRAADGLAINLEGGNDTLNLFAGETIAGQVNGGTGTDTLNLAAAPTGGGTGTLANIVNFEQLNVTGGSWTVSDTETFGNGVSLSGGLLELAAAGGLGSTITFAGPATLQLDAAALAPGGTFANTIAGLSSADVLDLRGLSFAPGAVAVYDPVTGQLTVSSNGQAASLTLSGLGPQAFTAAADNAGGTAVQEVACYCPGTRILTDRGEMPVEALAVGDRLVTWDGTAEPIRWIGRRSYAGRFLAGRPALHPIRIRAGALDGALPRRDLVVSPCHALFLDGLLVPAGELVNGTTIVRDEGLAQVDYFHVELAPHAVIWAEGAASETFADDDSRGVFHNAAEYGGPAGQTTYCAPRVTSGYALDAIRRRTAGLAAAA